MFELLVFVFVSRFIRVAKKEFEKKKKGRTSTVVKVQFAQVDRNGAPAVRISYILDISFSPPFFECQSNKKYIRKKKKEMLHKKK
jgi:hypothetical protein